MICGVSGFVVDGGSFDLLDIAGWCVFGVVLHWFLGCCPF